MTSNQHLYFCIDSTCDKMVDYYNAPCCLEHNPLVQGNEETLSHETSECPGCGNDMYCSANGYCSNCWVERFGCDDDTVSLSPISTTWPKYITNTRSLMYRTTFKSWLMNTYVRPKSSFKSNNKFRTWASTDLSKADTASSKMIKRDCKARARAMFTRWR